MVGIKFVYGVLPVFVLRLGSDGEGGLTLFFPFLPPVIVLGCKDDYLLAHELEHAKQHYRNLTLGFLWKNDVLAEAQAVAAGILATDKGRAKEILEEDAKFYSERLGVSRVTFKKLVVNELEKRTGKDWKWLLGRAQDGNGSDYVPKSVEDFVNETFHGIADPKLRQRLTEGIARRIKV